ncbi:MAG: AAA domain-containing protein [Acidimicrobiales bacterium]
MSVPVVLERGSRGERSHQSTTPRSPRLSGTECSPGKLLEEAFYGLGEAAGPGHQNSLHSGFQTWAQRVALGAGIVIMQWAGPEQNPVDRRNTVGLAAIAGAAIYVADPTPTGNRGQHLRDWSANHKLDGTAFAAVYGGAGPRTLAEADAPIPPTRPLNETQRAVVVSSMRQSVTTVSGPPGTGKTHTVAEIALAAVARGESVLIGANSPHAVDVLRAHFLTSPGPQPITFGGRRVDNPRQQILDRLNSGADRKLEAEQRARRDATAADRAQLANSIGRMLAAESQVARLVGDPTSRLDMEDRLDRAGDVDDLRDRLADYQNTGVLANLKRGRRRRDLIRRFSLREDADLPEFIASMTALDDYLWARRILADGGLTLVPSFDQLAQRDDDMRDAAARWLDAAYLRRVSRAPRADGR